jgi:transposase
MIPRAIAGCRRHWRIRRRSEPSAAPRKPSAERPRASAADRSWCTATRSEGDVELIAPNRANRKIKTQDGRPLRRYKRRWKIERLLAWLHNFRRPVTHWEYDVLTSSGFVQLGCIVILLRRCV